MERITMNIQRTLRLALMILIVPIAAMSQGPCTQTNWNDSRLVDAVPLPCDQNDFQRHTLYLQNMQIIGRRFFTAETSGSVGNDIVAGAAVTTCASNGPVVISRETRYYDPWPAGSSVGFLA